MNSISMLLLIGYFTQNGSSAEDSIEKEQKIAKLEGDLFIYHNCEFNDTFSHISWAN